MRLICCIWLMASASFTPLNPLLPLTPIVSFNSLQLTRPLSSHLPSGPQPDERRIPFQSLHSRSRVSLIVEKLLSSDLSSGTGFSHRRSDDGDVAELMGCTDLTEKMMTETELRRLREVSLRMKVGPEGVTERVVERIHERWKEAELVKLMFEGPDRLQMKMIKEDLERKTGGLVIWRSGSLLVIYRGMTYESPCAQSYSQISSTASTLQIVTDSSVEVSKSFEDNVTTSLPSEGSTNTSDIDSLLDQLGPRYKDWSGSNQLPVDADLLPGVVAGYKQPFRLLPYRTRNCLRNREMTSLRRLAKTVPPHFALGRNRQHQGLATCIVKLWGKSAIAKIAIKHGVSNTCIERMAEEIKAQEKVLKAEKALAKVQEFLQPAELPTDLETVTDEERFLFRKIGLKMRASFLLGKRAVFDGTIQNMHLNWKHREVVKIIVKGRNFPQIKHIAISLEAESGGLLISVDKTTTGYAIILYRGKNYQRPSVLRPKNLLTKRQALARSIELQRREALNHHISNLRKKIRVLKSQLDQMEAAREAGNTDLDVQFDDTFLSDDNVEDEGEEAYLETYSSGDENCDQDDESIKTF